VGEGGVGALAGNFADDCDRGEGRGGGTPDFGVVVAVAGEEEEKREGEEAVAEGEEGLTGLEGLVGLVEVSGVGREAEEGEEVRVGEAVGEGGVGEGGEGEGEREGGGKEIVLRTLGEGERVCG